MIKRNSRQGSTYTAAWPTMGLFIFVTMGFAWIVRAGMTHQLPLGICILCNTLLLYLNFTVLHEAAHRNIFGKKKSLKGPENLIGWISALLLTVPFPVFRQIHLTHHAFTNDPVKDPDYWVEGDTAIKRLLKFMTIIPAYYYHFYRLNFKDRKSQQRPQMIMGFIFVYILTFVWGMTMGWQYPLLFWWLPAFFASTILAFGFNWLPHHPHHSMEKYHHTRIFDIPLLTPLLMWQNYHLIHHLYPGIPFYLYRRQYLQDKPMLLEQDVVIYKNMNRG
jgi:fatty acid desaturase